MPTYIVTAPDGREYEVDAPEGATQEEVLAYAQQNYEAAAEQPWQPVQRSAEDLRAMAEPVDPTEGMAGGERFWAGAGKSLMDTGRGVGQLLGLVDESEVAQARETDAPLMATGAGMAGNILGQAAQIATPLPGGAAVGLAGKLAASGGRAGVFGGAQGTVGDESRLANAGRDAAFGVAGQGIASGAGAMASRARQSLTPAVQQSIEMAERAGIPLHASQVRNSRFLKGVSSALNELPFSGGAKAARNQQEGFNRAVGRSFGVDDAPALTDDVMQAARQRIGAVYDDIYSRNTVRLDDDAVKALESVRQQAARNLTPDDARIVNNQIDDILEAAKGGMPGAQYQAFRTDRLLPLEGGSKTFTTKMIRDVRKALDEAAERSVGPQDAQALALARRQYRNMKTADKALGRVAGAQGNVQPAALWPVVNQKFGSTSEMRELAKIGQNVLKDPIPNSGTPLRQLVYGATAGGGALAAGIAPEAAMTIGTGALLARVLNSSAAARALKQGAPTSGLARLLQPAPRLLPAAAPSMGIPITGGQVGPWTAEDDAELERLRAEMEARRRASQGR